MEALQIIPVDQLNELKGLYKIDWPLHISTCSTIQLFIDRFEKHLEWVEKVSFFSIDDDWKRFGTFVMINEGRIFFNTLESFPFHNLRETLQRVDVNERLSFVNIRDALRPVILDFVRCNHLEVVSDIGTKCFLMTKEYLKNVTIE